jgi:hypothetical protein
VQSKLKPHQIKGLLLTKRIITDHESRNNDQPHHLNSELLNAVVTLKIF